MTAVDKNAAWAVTSPTSVSVSTVVTVVPVSVRSRLSESAPPSIVTEPVQPLIVKVLRPTPPVRLTSSRTRFSRVSDRPRELVSFRVLPLEHARH